MTATDVRSETVRTPTPRAYWFYGDLITIHVTGDETAGKFCLVEFLQPPGEWTPLHVHRDSDQTQYVIEGELTVYQPGRCDVIGPGQSVNTRADVPHTECVTSPTPAKVLDVNAPAGFDAFLVSAGEPAAALTLPPPERPDPDLERMAALALELANIELLGPPGQLP